jgi:hypothetical protein
MPLMCAVAMAPPPSRKINPVPYTIPPTCVEDVYGWTRWDGTGVAQFVTTYGVDLTTGGGWLILIREASLSYGSEMVWVDSLMGVGKYFTSSGVQTTDAQTVTSITSTGFNIGTSSVINTSGSQYTAVFYKKTPQFFDLKSYTGTGGAQNIYHNLDNTPQLMIFKNNAGGSLNQVNPISGGGLTACFGGDMNSTTGTNPYGASQTTWVSGAGGTSPQNPISQSAYITLGTSSQLNGNTNGMTVYFFAGGKIFGAYPQSYPQVVFNSNVVVTAGSQYSFQRNANWTGFQTFIHQSMMTFPSTTTGQYPTMGIMYNCNFGKNLGSSVNSMPKGDSYYSNASYFSVEYNSLRGWGSTSTTDTGSRLSPTAFNQTGSAQLSAVVSDRIHKPSSTGTKIFSFLNAVGAFRDQPLYPDVTNFVASIALRVGSNFNGSTDRHDGLGSVYGDQSYVLPNNARSNGNLGAATLASKGVYSTFYTNNGGSSEYGFLFRYAVDCIMPFVYRGDGTNGNVATSWNIYAPTNNTLPAFVYYRNSVGSPDFERFYHPSLGSSGLAQYFNQGGTLQTPGGVWLDPSNGVLRVYAFYGNNTSGTEYRGFVVRTIDNICVSGTYAGTGANQNVNLNLASAARFLWVAGSNSQLIRMYAFSGGTTYCGEKNNNVTPLTTPTDTTPYTSGTANSSGVTLTSTSPINVNGVTYYYWAVN